MVARGEVWGVDFGDPFGSEPGLRRPAAIVSSSVVNVSQLLVIDRRRLVERSGTLAPVTVSSVDAGLRLVLAL